MLPLACIPIFSFFTYQVFLGRRRLEQVLHVLTKYVLLYNARPDEVELS